VKTKSWDTDFVSEDDRKKIEQSIRMAEVETQAEIVPMIVKSSGHYPHVWVLLFLITTTLLFLFEIQFGFLQSLLFAVLLLPLSLFSSRSPRVIRWLTHDIVMTENAERRAEIEFHRLNMTGTAQRTGVLIFVSVLEHKAIVLSDKTISDRLPPTIWDELLRDLLSGLRRGDPGGGFQKAIEHAAQVLKTPFPSQAKNPNELCDRLVIKS